MDQYLITGSIEQTPTVPQNASSLVESFTLLGYNAHIGLRTTHSISLCALYMEGYSIIPMGLYSCYNAVRLRCDIKRYARLTQLKVIIRTCDILPFYTLSDRYVPRELEANW